MHLLVVCTANICRSPMAEALLRDAAHHHRVDATVASAGTHATGAPVSPDAAVALAAYDLALAGHRSRRLDATMIAAADLVLTMETAHVRDAAVLAPHRFSWIYTLRELVARSETVGPRDGRDLDAWLADLGQHRTAAAVLAAGDLDVEDPYGGPEEGYAATAAELAALADAVAKALWAPA